MNYAVYLSIISFFTFMPTVVAMENKENIFPESIIKPIKTKSYISHVKYITNNSVLIANNQGCRIVDLGTRKRRRINPKCCSYVQVFPDKEKIALSYDNTIEIYNTKTAKIEWSKTQESLIYSFGINSQEDTLILSLITGFLFRQSMVVKHNYKKNICDENYSITNSRGINNVFCPKQQLVCVNEVDGNMLLYPLADSKVEPRKITLEHDIAGCQVGSGDFMAVKDPYGASVSLVKLNGDGGEIYHCLKQEENHYCERILFYPAADILAITSTVYFLSDSEDTIDLDDKRNSYFMDYWDINTKKFMYRMPLEESPNNFSFSPDGKNVIIAFGQQCKVYSVPLEVRKKEILPYLFLLGELVNKQSLNIPEEIRLLLKYTLLTAFRR